MSVRKKTTYVFGILPFLSRKEKGGRKHAESLSEMLYGLQYRSAFDDNRSDKNRVSNNKKIEKTKGKKISYKLSLVFFKEKRRKKRTEGLSKTLHDLGLNYSSVQDQYAKTRASVQKEDETKSISSSLSSSLPVSLL